MVADPAMRLARRAIDQRAQIVLGTGNGDILEHVAAGIHQRHHGAGERLTERQRRAHRHQRDRIDAERPASRSRTIETASPATTGVVASVQNEIGEIRLAVDIGDAARGQSQHRDRDKCPSQDALKQHRSGP